jgi:hypothetical protein
MFFNRARLVSLEADVGSPHGRWATEFDATLELNARLSHVFPCLFSHYVLTLAWKGCRITSQHPHYRVSFPQLQHFETALMVLFEVVFVLTLHNVSSCPFIV